MAKIFIVEDSKIVTLHLQKTLESAGYEVIGTESSGEGLLEKIKSVTPDLILMDIMVAGVLDGIETATKVKEKYSIPVIYITALTDPGTIQRAKVTEPYGYLTKPFEDRDIFAVVEMALYKHSVEEQLRRTEERFVNTLNSISDGVITIDNDHTITYINPTAQILTGFYDDKAIGKSLLDVLQLEEQATGIFPFNPLHCEIGIKNTNALPSGLVLKSKKSKTPVGAGSMAPITNGKGELTGLVIIFKDLTELLLREKIERNMEKKRLTALIEGQERERGRVSRELHDGLGQMLNAIKMKFADNHEASQLLDGALVEISKISENLMPYKLNDFQLQECLQSLTDQFDNRNVKINFTAFGENLSINENQKINLYRIAQEGLTNAVKHSKATTISLQLINDLDKIQLIIEDNGVGFCASKIGNDGSSHHGMINMQERAESMGGSFIVESDTQRGTLLIVEAPLQ